MKVKLFLLLFVVSSSCLGQLKVIDSLKVSKAEHLSVDRSGDIYLGDIFGNVIKYSSDLKEIDRFSPSRKGGISVLEAWNPLRIFVAYNDIQEYVFLDRFLVNANQFSLKEISSYVGVCAPSLDNNLWLVDYTDFSLKKYNITFNQIEINRAFDLLLDPDSYAITHIREYQNLLFLCDKKSGILVFDNMANYLYSIKGQNINHLSFWKNDLYYTEGSNLNVVNLYTNEKKVIYLQENVDRLVATDKHYFYLTEKYLFKAQNE